MEKESAVIEITSSAVKITVGYELDDRPHVIYTSSRPISGMVENGIIVNPSALINVISSISKIEDEEAKLRITINDIVLVVPPLGLEIYQGDQTTSVLNEKDGISKLDIGNVIKLVKNQMSRTNNVIVDIIPDKFLLDQERVFGEPPLGVVSTSLTVKAKVHTLPRSICHEYRHVIESAGIRVKRVVVAPYCVARLLANDSSLPKSFIYFDCGDQITTATIISGGSIFNSCYFFGGGNKLSNVIQNKFGINKQDADNIIRLYGYDTRKLSYNPIVCTVKDHDDNVHEYTVIDLNECIKQYLDSYIHSMKTSLAQLKTAIPSQKDLPIVIGGGFSKLSGLVDYIRENFNYISVYEAPLKVIGARDPKYLNSVGAILTISKYRGTLEDSTNRVTPVNREENKHVKNDNHIDEDVI